MGISGLIKTELNNAAQRGARTHDPEIKSLMLSDQLSYSRARWIWFFGVCTITIALPSIAY